MAHAWYALLLEELGRPEEALQEFALAEQADPLSLPILVSSVQLLRWLGRLDEAQPKIKRLEEAKTSLWGPWVQVYEYYMARSEPERALQGLDRAKELRPGDPRLLPLYADYYARIGQKDRAHEVLRQFESQSESLPYSDIAVADVYTTLNELDEVFRWLNRAETKWINMGYWRISPRAAQVRADPRFLLLLKKLNLA